MEKNLAFQSKAFEALPQSLKASSYIDFLLFLGGLKPSLRLHVTDPQTQIALESWGKEHGYASASNPSGYIYIAKTQDAALCLQELDDSQQAHEYELGLMLGYPPCCCRKAAEVGESNLDEWEESMSQHTDFGHLPNCLIDPRGYTEGSSLISHIPCSAQCEASLSIAKATLRIIHYQKDSYRFRRWSKWFEISCAC